jgi:signal transduction histidine kinase
MLRQVLMNLLRNAVEAITEDESMRLVDVHTFADKDPSGDNWAVIEIEDSGPGIPQGDLQRIFIPFFTTKASGHGVGLALAHRVITEHNGTLTAVNGTDRGALFTIRLPL